MSNSQDVSGERLFPAIITITLIIATTTMITTMVPIIIIIVSVPNLESKERAQEQTMEIKEIVEDKNYKGQRVHTVEAFRVLGFFPKA